MINDEDMNGNQNDLESLTSAGVYGECYTVVIGMFLQHQIVNADYN